MAMLSMRVPGHVSSSANSPHLWGRPVKPGKARNLYGLGLPLERLGRIAADLCACPQKKRPQLKDDPMDNPGTRETVPPTADIKTLHRELQQLFVGTQSSNGGPGEKTGDTSAGSGLVIKGK
jgi:hypothetical protein